MLQNMHVQQVHTDPQREVHHQVLVQLVLKVTIVREELILHNVMPVHIVMLQEVPHKVLVQIVL